MTQAPEITQADRELLAAEFHENGRGRIVEGLYDDDHIVGPALRAIARLRVERDGYEERWASALRSRQHTQQWYAERLERLKDLCKEFRCWDQAAAIIANGSATGEFGGEYRYDTPTYAQQLNNARHRAAAAEDKALKASTDLTAVRALLAEAGECLIKLGDTEPLTYDKMEDDFCVYCDSGPQSPFRDTPYEHKPDCAWSKAADLASRIRGMGFGAYMPENTPSAVSLDRSSNGEER